jgi:glycine reductase
MQYRIVHYINQFYAGKGGEDKADHKPESVAGPMGPGAEIARLLKKFGDEGEIVGTVICGDSYYGENIEDARAACLGMIEAFKPDLLLAGPAFNAGRYGVACGDIAVSAGEKLGIPVVTGMYKENPGVELYSKGCYIVPSSESARSMRQDLEAMTKLGLKLAKKEPMGPAREEGYFSRGIRKCFFREDSGAARAVGMMLARLRGEAFQTEYEMPVFKKIPPAAPVRDMKNATIAIISSGGVVPKGNPDHIRVSSADKFGFYDITNVDDLTPESFESIHGGYDRAMANLNPDCVVPVDELRKLEKEGVFKKLHHFFYATTGTGTSVNNAEQFGQEIGKKLREAGVDAAILTST